ncbi:phage integrase central domain-containing protein [Sphingobium sp. Leaf26]|uniref:phage integrase central domain-containing protein n=1 Tax=Sphingobium sp. Leaf26 TaxID=1735693 RepID=UPI000A5C6A3F|nr:hypothetical protein [Sphingobium sp. Leaf26]
MKGNGCERWKPSPSLIGDIRVSEITGRMIRNVLAEIWLTKPEKARRVRQRIGAVLDWAFASGYRETEAPMRSITKGFPRQPKKDGHFAAMPYADVAAFMVRLREGESFKLAVTMHAMWRDGTFYVGDPDTAEQEIAVRNAAKVQRLAAARS